MSAPSSHPGSLARLTGVPPELLYVLSGLAIYAGAAVAVVMFDRLPAAGVAWYRVMFGGLLLAVLRRSWRRTWTRRQVVLVAAFGTVLASMNLVFYLAIDRLPLGTAVAIEFIGPVAVAAIGSRTVRSVVALLLAGGGVVVLADVQREASTAGVVLALAAGALWAGYIVLGTRVAREGPSVDGLALGMLIGAVAIAPVALPDALRGVDEPIVVVLALLTAVLSNVIPYGLDQVIMSRIPRARFALLLALLPVTATLTGLVALRQVPGLLEVGGIAMVAIGIAVAERR